MAQRCAEQDEPMILVQTQSLPRDDIPIVINGIKSNMLLQFHLVDLNRDIVHLDCAPPLVSLAVLTSMALLNDSLFIFGSLYRHVRESAQLHNLQSLTLEPPLALFLGSSLIKLKSDQSQADAWATVPGSTVDFPTCFTMLGKIYLYRISQSAPMVLDDPTLGKWTELPLPSHLSGSLICGAIPDPANRRILVHLSDFDIQTYSLYSFTPPDCCPADVHGSESTFGEWDPIDLHFRSWFKAFTLAGDVLYFHCEEISSVIWGYDLKSRVWLNVRWSGNFDDKVNMNGAYIGYDELLHLGGNNFCLTTSSSMWELGQRKAAEILFYKFKVERCKDELILNPIGIKSYLLPGTARVKNVLAV